MEFTASFSGGKDSALSIKRMLDRGHRLTSIIVSTRDDEEKSWTHGLSKEYFRKAAEILRCDVIFTDTDADGYETAFETALKKAVSAGARGCVFGDIDIAEHIKWNVDRCRNSGIEAIHPLLYEDREKVMNEWIQSNMDAYITKTDGKRLERSYVKRKIDRSFLEDVKNRENFDICGENGEYHTEVDLDTLSEISDSGIYADNASTSFPKAPGVSTRVAEFIDRCSYSIGRGTYMDAYMLSSRIIDIRDRLLAMTDAAKKSNCIFTSSATEAVNMSLRGIITPGEKIISGDMTHNSAWRTFNALSKEGVSVEEISFRNKSDEEIAEEFFQRTDDDTKIIYLTLVDNVSGKNNYETLKKTIEKVKKKNDRVLAVVDGVQALCEIDFSIDEMGADVFIMSPHIGMMAAEGVGVMILNEKASDIIRPVNFGGTGSASNDPEMPQVMPDRLEAGTLNTPSIISIEAALDYIEHTGIERIIEKKHRLGKKLRDSLEKINGIDIIGEGSFCCISVQDEKSEADESYISFMLDRKSRIMNRVGIQCSAKSQEYLGTFPRGVVRLSMGYFNNDDDIEKISCTVREILTEQNGD